MGRGKMKSQNHPVNERKTTFEITIKYEAQVPGRAKKEPPTITINIFLTNFQELNDLMSYLLILSFAHNDVVNCM